MTLRPGRWLIAATVGYTLGVALIARGQGVGFDSAELVPAGHFSVAEIVLCLTVVLGLGLALFLPGLALTRAETAGPSVTKSFLATVMLHTLLLTIVKLGGFELTRTWFLASCLGVWIVTVTRSTTTIRIESDTVRNLLATACLLLLVTGVFFSEIFFEDFAGDGTEHFSYAVSLKSHLLPYWDLENGFWGFHPRFMAFAYPSALAILAIGEVEAAVRLPGIAYLGMIFLAINALSRHLDVNRWWVRFAAAVALLQVFYFNAHYSTWDPFVSDIAEPLTTDLLTIYLVLSCLRFSVLRRQAMSVACGLLASLCTQGGTVLVAGVLMVRTAFTTHRRPALMSVALFAAGYAVLLVLAELHARVYPRGETIFGWQNLIQYWTQVPDPAGIAIQLLFLILTTGGLVVIAVPFLAGRDELSTQLWVAACGYSMLLALSSRVNPHYFLAPAILLIASFARRLGLVERPARWALASAASVLTSLFLVMPADQRLSDLASNVGGRMRIDATDYETQVNLASAIHEVFPFPVYGISHHTLVYYANRATCVSCDYIITANPEAWSSHQVLSGQGARTVLGRIGLTETLAAPARGSSCVPWMRRLYSAYRTNVESGLTGPSRLPWALCLNR